MSDERDGWVGDYLMGEMASGEREQMERAMKEDPALGERLRGMERVTSMLESLPDAAWEAVGQAPAPAKRAGRTPALRRLRPALVASGCALLLGAGVAVGVLIEQPSSPSGPTVVLRALSGVPSPDRATARMTVGGRMVLNVEDLPATAKGHFYELWLMNSTSDLVAVASFSVGVTGKAELDVPLPVSAGRYHFLDISLQQAAAGPAHSGDSVLRAPLPS